MYILIHPQSIHEDICSSHRYIRTLLPFFAPFTSAWTTIPLVAVRTSSSSPISIRNPSTLHVGINIEKTDPNQKSASMEEVSPALNLNRHLKRITSLVTSVAGLIVTLAAISTQPVMTLFRGSIPSTIAWIITAVWFGVAHSRVLPQLCLHWIHGPSKPSIASWSSSTGTKCGICGSKLRRVGNTQEEFDG